MATFFFCHGAPGSPRDATLLTCAPQDTIIAPNLFAEPALHAFDRTTPDPVHVIGFSLGAMAAIQIAASRPEKVSTLTLISPAAPLQLGDFLPDMAGKPVFTLAQNHPRGLRALTKAQALFSAALPAILLKQLFATCNDAEKALLRDPEFCATLKYGLTNSFRDHPEGYLRGLHAYVMDWSADLARLHCPVHIWHGDADTWAPPAMSVALADAIQGAVLHWVNGGGHYVTLKSAHLNPHG